MTRRLFSQWFHNDFVPSVREYSTRQGIESRALLVVDNCSAHNIQFEGGLKSDDGKIEMIFFPPNITALGQPMDQGVIRSVKTKFKNSILHQILLEKDENKSFEDRLKSINLLEVVKLVAKSWNEVK